MGNAVAKNMPPPSPEAVAEMTPPTTTQTTLGPDGRSATSLASQAPSSAPSGTQPAAVEQKAESVKQAKPAPVAHAQPAPVANVQPAPVEPVKAAPVEMAKPAPVETAKPAPIQPVQAKPIAPVEMAKQTPIAHKPAPIEPAKPAAVKLETAAQAVKQETSPTTTDTTPSATTRTESTIGSLPATPEETSDYSPFGTPAHVFATPEIATSFNIAAAVTSFSIAGEKRKFTTADDVSVLVAHLSAHRSTLHSVVLSGNSFGLEAAAALAAVVSAGMPVLEDLDLSDMFTGRTKKDVPPAVAALGSALAAGAPALRRLKVSDNAFGPDGASAVASIIRAAPLLEAFVSNNNGYGPQGGTIIAEALLGLAQKQKATSSSGSGLLSSQGGRLRRVEIGQNRLEDGSAPALAKAIAAMGALEELALYQNGIRPDGIAALAAALPANPALRVLNLQDNTFAVSGAQALAAALPALPALEVLNCGDSYLQAAGCAAIAGALPASLHELDLQFNEMAEECVAQLAARVPALPALSALLLNGNAFDPEGAAAGALRQALGARVSVLDKWTDMEWGDSDGSLSDSSDDADGKGVVPPGTSLSAEEMAAELEKLDL